MNDTWLWNGTSWTRASPQTSPPARRGAAMTYDVGHSQAVLFGGDDLHNNYFADTWVWDGSTWTQKTSAASPSPRSQTAMAYDIAHGQVVLFGGSTDENDGLGDTWVWDGVNWTRKTPQNSPAGRFGAAMAYDATHEQAVLFGGATTESADVGDTWIWDGTNWTAEAPKSNPSARDGSGMIYDSARSQIVLFGGESAFELGNEFADTWTWLGGPLAPPGPTITSVVSASGFGGFSTVAPGTWVEIYGSNLAPDTRQWAGSDFSGNNAPTSLDGVKVSIGGQNAFIDYISSSPGQVNAELPSNISTGGTLQLTLTNGTASSSPYNITVNTTQPGLLAPSSFLIGGKQYVVALLPDGATYILPTGAIAGVTSRPAHPGETIILYGIGFGAVTPNIPAGQIVTESNQLSQPLQILFGQTPAQVPYAGFAPGFVGLYQFNLVVPPIPDNNLVPLTFNLGGLPGSQTLYTAVQE
jgi:uncharacterized protein (TIGR03437 family)